MDYCILKRQYLHDFVLVDVQKIQELRGAFSNLEEIGKLVRVFLNSYQLHAGQIKYCWIKPNNLHHLFRESNLQFNQVQEILTP